MKDRYDWGDFNPNDHTLYYSVYNNVVRVTWYVQLESDGTEYIFAADTASFIVENHHQPLTLDACLAELPDANYQPIVGDKFVHDVEFENASTNESREYDSVYLGSTFSWLDDTNVTDLPAVLAQGALTKTKVTGRDSDGAELFCRGSL